MVSLKAALRTFVPLGLLLWVPSIFFCTCAQAESREKVKIGLALPFSGSLQFQGVFTRKGIELYMLEHPDFSNRVELIYEDVGSNAAQGISAVRKLLDVDRVDLMVLEVSPTANAAAPLIDRAQVPTLAIVGADAARGWKYMIKLWIPSKNEGKAVAKYLAEWKLNRVALLTSEQDSMLARAAALRDEISASMIVFSGNVATSEDIAASAQNILRAKPNVVVANLMPGLTAILTRRLRELGYAGRIVGSVVISDQAEIEASQGALADAVYPDVDAQPEFIKNYRAKYNELPSLGSANGYDSMKLFDYALSSVDFRFDKHAVNQALRVSRFKGALGEFSFLTDGSNSMDVKAVMVSLNGSR